MRLEGLFFFFIINLASDRLIYNRGNKIFVLRAREYSCRVIECGISPLGDRFPESLKLKKDESDDETGAKANSRYNKVCVVTASVVCCVRSCDDDERAGAATQFASEWIIMWGSTMGVLLCHVLQYK